MDKFKFDEKEREHWETEIYKAYHSIGASLLLDRIETLISSRADGWVKVSDGLPEFGQRVLVAYEPPSPLMERWDYTVTKRQDVPLGTGYARMMDDNKFRINGTVTHWMPLPQPPKTAQQ